VAIAVLLFFSLQAMLFGVWAPLFRIANFFFEAIAILDIPYFAHPLSIVDRTMFLLTFIYLSGALFSFASAWMLSRWVYGVGPFQSLIECLATLLRRTRV